MLNKEVEESLLMAQKSEITEHFIYKKLARSLKGPNKGILERISNDELRHYEFWSTYTKKDTKPNRIKVLMYLLISKIFGITFGMKIMEKGEEKAQENYKKIS
ncbi:MAG: hypothetical protein N3F06_02380, partial [Nitrososphaerales archaeon]|nr:hypothetical protein [Nitrososphaerales archaeon]